MTRPTPSYLTDLRQGIVGAFSIEELVTLCFDLGVDYENLGGQGKEGKARELIAHLIRRDELAPLVQYCARKRPRYPWPQDPALTTQAPLTSDAQNLEGGVPPRTTDWPPPRSNAATRHSHQQLTELQGRYETLSKRIAALDKDLGHTLDSETKLVLEERRQELVAERDRAAADMARIEQQLAGVGVVAPSLAAQAAPAASLSSEERASLTRQLAASRENLRLIEERKSQFVQETDIPLQLVKDERRVRERITELQARLAQP